jgi:hypothetical protein
MVEKPKILQKISIGVLLVAAIITLTANFNLFSSDLAEAQSFPPGTISGGGIGEETFCGPNSSGGNIAFAANFDPETGDVTSGDMTFSNLFGAAQPQISSGEVTASTNSYSLEGSGVNTFCGTPGVPYDFTISGVCGTNVEITLTSEPNVIGGTFIGDVVCVFPTPPPERDLTEEFPNQGQCISEANADRDDDLTREDCQAAFRAERGNNGNGNGNGGN